MAKVEEIILIFNPIYPDKMEQAKELLVRMQYQFVKQVTKTLTYEQALDLLGDKFGESQMEDGIKLIKNFSNREITFFHLSKLAADREVRAIYAH